LARNTAQEAQSPGADGVRVGEMEAHDASSHLRQKPGPLVDIQRRKIRALLLRESPEEKWRHTMPAPLWLRVRLGFGVLRCQMPEHPWPGGELGLPVSQTRLQMTSIASSHRVLPRSASLPEQTGRRNDAVPVCTSEAPQTHSTTIGSSMVPAACEEIPHLELHAAPCVLLSGTTILLESTDPSWLPASGPLALVP
jgi:hypothetical protein